MDEDTIRRIKRLKEGRDVVILAHMITSERIAEVREEYEDVAVVCYVNSTAEIKEVSDVCVTSSNAVRVVSRIKAKNIFFVPDNNLGRYVAGRIPEKNFIVYDGFCHVHKSIEVANVLEAKKLQPEALVLTHPECTWDVVELSDFKKFYSVRHRQFCPNMKKVTLKKVVEALEKMEPEVILPQDIMEKALTPLQKMLELA